MEEFHGGERKPARGWHVTHVHGNTGSGHTSAADVHAAHGGGVGLAGAHHEGVPVHSPAVELADIDLRALNCKKKHHS